MPKPQNFHTIPHVDISKGIDQRSAPNSVKAGYSEDMRNIDTNSTGFIKKRKGYQGYKGNLPLRAESFTVSGSSGSCIFNSDINLLLSDDSPIVIYGTLLQNGTGTISSSGTTVTGSGTAFTTELREGSILITATGESQIVKSITNATSLTIGAAFSPDLSSADFTHRTVKEYKWSTYVNDSRKTVAATTTTTYTVNHANNSTQLAAGLVNTPTADSTDNYSVYADKLIFGSDADEVHVTIDNQDDASKDFYILLEDVNDENVVTYRAAISESLVSGSMTLTIPAATHELPNLHILPFIYIEKDAGAFTQIIPNSFTIDSSGAAVIEVDNAIESVGTTTTFEGQIVLIDVPSSQALESSLTGGTGKTIQFENVDDEFNFFALFNRELDGSQTQVIPNTIFHDSTTKTVTVTLDTTVGRNLKLIYTPASVKSNIVTLAMDSYDDVITDTSPSVNVWGIPHDEIIYKTGVSKGSWVNSLEEYSSQGVNRVIAGIGGSLCAETGTSNDITLPSYFIDIRRRVDALRTIGPFFAEFASKDRGLECANRSSSSIPFTSITNNGDATATIQLNSGVKFGSLADLVTTTSTTGNDKITISNAGNSYYNGTFDIASIAETISFVTADSLGIAGVVKNSSSQVTFTFDSAGEATSFHSTYLADGYKWSWIDDLNNVYLMEVQTGGSDLLDPSGGTTIVVTTTAVTLSGTNTDFTDVNNTTFTTEKMRMESDTAISTLTIEISGLPDYIASESDSGASGVIVTDYLIMSATNEDGNNEDLPYEIEDTIVGTLFEDAPEVLGVDSSYSSSRRLFLSNITANIIVPAGAQLNGSRTSTTHTLTSVDYIVKGDTISALGFDRQFQVQSIDVSSNTITLDESITLSDDPAVRDYITITGRWITIEAPSLNSKPIIYFDQNEMNAQDKLRGASINDSIFYTNYEDEVMKYDGNSIYRAGLINWQPRTHSWINDDNAGIPVTRAQYISAKASGNKLYFTTLPDLEGVNELYFVGDDGVNTTATANITIDAIDETNLSITLNASDLTLSDAGYGHIVIPQKAAYYFKLQVIDRNNNLIASAVTDYQECVINLTQNGTITHKLTGLPKFDIYDYSRIDLLVFRTEIGKRAVPPFYQIKRIPIDFELAKASNSILVTDTVPDSSLPIGALGDDTVSIALKGGELPLVTDQPPRCKYIGTVDNRLILGNIKGYNRADVTLISDSGITEDNVLGNATAQIDDDDNSKTFEYFDFTDGTTSLNTTNNIEVTTITTANTSEFILTTTGSVGYSLVDKYIQLSSFFTDANGTSLYTTGSRSRTNTVEDVGHLIGWWKVKSHTVTTNDVITVEYTHGLGATPFTFGATTNPIYVTFPDTANSNIPIVAIPYAITATNRIVEDVVYDDTDNSLEFTSAVNRGVRDLKMAFNQIMVEETSPWAYALSGATEGNGRILFESALPGKTLTITITEGGSTDLEIFINEVKRLSGLAVDGITKVFPSRLLISPPNFPEMFDNPFADTISVSDSLLDINANDGQEITGMSTFLADSTGAHGSLESTLLVFKNQSVYSVNVESRLLQKLESMGQGCTIPDSISATQDGIMFANNSGIYKIGRDLSISYAGRNLERYWNEEVNSTTVIDSAVAYTDSSNRKYKLSIPVGSNTKNSEMVVLDYIVDDTIGEGSWGVYDNFNAAAWIQTNSNSYFGNFMGRIFGLRKSGDSSDYRDDASAITSSFTYGAQSFGDQGSRAVLNRIISHFQVDTSITKLTVAVAVDMNQTFSALDDISFSSGSSEPKLVTVANGVDTRHGLYFQVKYTHNVINENFILAGIDFKVQPLPELGIDQAPDI